MLTTLHRFNRIVFNLIHFNNNINNQTKTELYKDLHNYTNEIILHHNSLEKRINNNESRINNIESRINNIESWINKLKPTFISKKSHFYNPSHD
jgi:hypothetical protein